ncbi:MAG TPA: NifU family protein [Candidatus Baltobacteraceae bacterium]|nr:NifU family protein [Candidatus Baltobacteraceae bacterium]
MIADRRALDVEELTGRVESLLRAANSRAADELVQTLVTLYGEGLRRVLDALAGAPGGADVLDRLCSDPFVSSLLIVHDLHPVPLAQRIEAALDKARPYIHSHGGKVEVVAIEGGVVKLRMSGTCDGCPASSATMKLNIEREIARVAPEILEVRSVT